MLHSLALALAVLGLTAGGSVRAQFADGLDGATADVMVLADADTVVQYVDYSTAWFGGTQFSIPEAPRRVAGSLPTRGLRLAANVSALQPAAVNVLAGRTPIRFSGRYRVSFDAWLSLATNPLPTDGTTECLLWGAGVAVSTPLEAYHNRGAGTTGTWGWLANENGFATEDAAIFDGGTELADLGDHQPGEARPFNKAFARPVDPGRPNRAPANEWVRVDVHVDGASVRVFFNDVEFFRVTSTSTDGLAMLGYGDPFASLMGFADWGWGLFDNFVVTELPVPFGIVRELDDANNGAWNLAPEAAECGTAHYGSLSAGDHDVWSFVLPVACEVVIYTTERGVANTCSDTILTLLDANGAVLEQNDDEPAAVGAFSRIARTLPAGVYHVEVRGAGGDSGDYAFDIVCGFAEPVPVVRTFFETEPNDYLSSLDPATCQDAIIGSLTPAGDVDFYRVVVASDTAVTFETHPNSGTTNVPAMDTWLWLHDAGGAVVANDNDSGAGSYSKLEFTLRAASSPYWIEVSHRSRTGSGDYGLTLACTPVPAAWAQAIDGASAGCTGSGGVPMAVHLRDGERPVRNAPYAFDVTGAVPGAVALLGVVGAPSPSIDLAVIGAPGCILSTTPIATVPLVPTVPGEAEFGLALFPVSDGLLGAMLEMQAAGVDLGANALGLLLSDRVTATVGSAF